MSNNESAVAERGDPLYVASVAKAFRVLEAFGHTITDLSLSEIGEYTGLDKSATQRFAHTLWQLGYLEKDERTRRFRLGKPVLDLSFYYLRSNALIELATPALIDLRNSCGERANLSLYDETTTIYVIRQQTKREYFDGSLIGRRIPVFCTAGGRAILAQLPVDEATAVIAKSDLKPKTPKTITDPVAIMEKVEEARESGFGLAVEETVLGEITVGAAVTNAVGRPIAAVHIAASTSDWTVDAFRERFAPLAIETAQALSRSQRHVTHRMR
ncbi:IclR family transcriptional regulator [Rhizobium mayense]|uniref:IclR family transcriptional regulator C-terminal domain-containing protein n=1 Tax=Rhizobium mayense TaxID=1312184 RepID=A0ABT7JQT4_9HYPH|nr:IclR family transcriptional regulator C-terminal domain-containing protein [Rhizobium mayense]MDL2398698.1 IclR family transcriptional regulator C-terminal domain-containing protein [Rhizobium mayense]